MRLRARSTIHPRRRRPVRRRSAGTRRPPALRPDVTPIERVHAANRINPIPAKTVCKGRYRVLARIGDGRFGTVWRAVDEHRGRQVALKQLTAVSEEDLRMLRQELTCLRVARLPNVVPLLDDFIEGGHGWLVLEYVEGRPFPGDHAHLRWGAVAPFTSALVLALAGLHARGVVHGDLKPDHARFDADGRVTLLDLGLGGGPALQSTAWHTGGTAPYAPREALEGHAHDAGGDLYAVGVMTIAAMLGRGAVEAPHLQGEALLASGAPPEVAEALLRMVSPDAARRPANALELIHVFGGESPFNAERLAPHLPARATREQLERLFVPCGRLLFAGVDAATALYHRTGGRRDRVLAELAAWLRTGRVRCTRDPALDLLRACGAPPDDEAAKRLYLEVDPFRADSLLAGERVRLHLPEPPGLSAREARTLMAVRQLNPDATFSALLRLTRSSPVLLRQTLQRLTELDLVWPLGTRRWGAEVALRYDGPTWPDRRVVDALPRTSALRLRVLRGIDEDGLELAHETLVWSALRLRSGRTGQVIPLIGSALRRVRALGEVRLERRLVRDLVLAAKLLDATYACEDALRLIEARQERDPEVDNMATLLRAWRRLHHGHAGRAEESLSRLTPFRCEPLEQLRNTCTFVAMYQQGAEQLPAWLASREVWALARVTRLARWNTWRGLMLYREGQPELAKAPLREAATLHTDRYLRAGARINLALALLDLGAWEEAEQIARRELHHASRARRLGNARNAALALRSAIYRRGVCCEPDLRWIFEGRQLGHDADLTFSLTEACAALSVGKLGLARAIALDGLRAVGFKAAGRIALLLHGLAVMLGSPAGETPLEDVAHAALRCPPGIAIQVIAMLRRGGLGPAWTDKLRSLAEQLPRESWDQVREIWSIRACLDHVGLAPPPGGALCEPADAQPAANECVPHLCVAPHGSCAHNQETS
jgi:tetratricopeptide (TPR) repeat protein